MPKSEDPLIGATLGNYLLEQSSGAGGFGRVYRAHHVNLSPTRKFAVKVLNTELSRQPEFAARFMREARATSEVRSPHIVEVYSYDQTTAGTLYYAMEFLDGEPLSATIKREGPFDWARTRHIALQICAALKVAHRKHIIHRDLKPDNCFRLTEGDDRDFIKIIDFGLARDVARQLDSLKTTKYAMGTPGYMPPEQTNNKGIDTYSDVWALAAIMFEMLAGDLPIKLRETYEQYIIDVNFTEPRRLFTVAPSCRAPREVEALLAKALHTEPMERFFTMAALSRAIEQVGRAPSAGSSTAPLVVAAVSSPEAKPAAPAPQAEQTDPFGDTLAPSGAHLRELAKPREGDRAAITRARRREEDEGTLLRAPPPLQPSLDPRASPSRPAAEPSLPKRGEDPVQRDAGVASEGAPRAVPSVEAPARAPDVDVEHPVGARGDTSTDIWPSLPIPASDAAEGRRPRQNSGPERSQHKKATPGTSPAATPEFASYAGDAVASKRRARPRAALVAVLALALAASVLIYSVARDNADSRHDSEPISSDNSDQVSGFASEFVELVGHSGRVLLVAGKSISAANEATTEPTEQVDTSDQIGDLVRTRIGDDGLTECNFLPTLTVKVEVRGGELVLLEEELHRFWETSSIDCLRVKVQGRAPEGAVDSGPYEVKFSG